jgi:hypothetical protein
MRMAEESIIGRDFNRPSNSVAIWEDIGNYPLLDELCYRDLFFHEITKTTSPVHHHMRNYSNFFLVGFHGKIIDWNEKTYFGEWFRVLHGANPSYANLMRKCTNDLDLTKLGKLFLYSKDHQFEPAPAELHVRFGLEKNRVTECNSLDSSLMECDSSARWVKCLHHVRTFGVVSPLLLQCIMKARISWCYTIKELTQTAFLENQKDLTMKTIQKMKTHYYDKRTDYDSMVNTAQ